MLKKITITALALMLPVFAMAQDIESLIRSMTLRQKIAQIIIISVDTHDSPQRREAQKQLVAQGLGGLIVMDDPLGPCIQMVNELQEGAAIPMLVSIDGEWGASMRFYEFAAFPKAMQLGALPSEELVYQAGVAIGEELSAIKIFANYAPDTDVNNNPANPVIGVRSFGEDRQKVAAYGSAYMRGMQSAGVAGCAKHFPGHGDTEVDSHKGLPVLNLDRSRLDSLELYPFRRMIADGVEMVMIGHLSVPALDPTGTPASISTPIVTGLLKEEMGFKGIVITDALGMKGVSNDYGDASVAAYKAGADILLMPQDGGKTIDSLEALFLSGSLDESVLDAKVAKMLSFKKKCGMLSEDYSPYVDPYKALKASYRPETEALIQRICDESQTVLQGSFPLDAGKTAYVAVNALSEESAEFFLELCKEHFPCDRFFLDGDATPAEIAALKEKLRGYDRVIVGFHSGKPIGRTGGPRREASAEKDFFESIVSWTSDINVYGIWFGNPYALAALPSYKAFKGFIVSYSDTSFNNRAAARAITRGSAKGILPVIIN